MIGRERENVNGFRSNRAVGGSGCAGRMWWLGRRPTEAHGGRWQPGLLAEITLDHACPAPRQREAAEMPRLVLRLATRAESVPRAFRKELLAATEAGAHLPVTQPFAGRALSGSLALLVGSLPVGHLAAVRRTVSPVLRRHGIVATFAGALHGTIAPLLLRARVFSAVACEIARITAAAAETLAEKLRNRGYEQLTPAGACPAGEPA